MKSMKFTPQITKKDILSSDTKQKSSISKPIIILVKPEHGGNIGATMRAMANFGLEELRLVKPKDNWFNFDCVRFSMGAMQHLKTIKRYNTLYEALKDINTSYALTVRSRKDMIKKTLTPSQAMEEAKSFTQKWAFVLGSEVSGLDNESVTLCNEIITIPTHCTFSSINLSQAAVICCYAWHAVGGNLAMKNVMIDSLPAKADTQKIHYLLQLIYSRLRENLSLTRTPNSLEITMQHLQNMIMRLQPTDKEVALFYRVTQLTKSKKSEPNQDKQISEEQAQNSKKTQVSERQVRTEK